MMGIEGTLMVPPERNQILGRPPWKPRYVTVARKEMPSKGSMSSSGQQSTTSATGLGRTRTFSDDFYLSVYKSKDDSEPSQQFPTASITNVDIQSIAHRKQGSILPTLVVTVSDKGKKRRSSRATGFMAGAKDCSFTLLFRSPLEGNHPSLDDWLNVIRSAKAPSMSSLESPISPSFVNPFTTRSRDASDSFGPRPRSRGGGGVGLHHKTSNYTHSSRDPPTFSSESMSLRSHKSDVSSPPSIHNNNTTTTTSQAPPISSYSAYSVNPSDTPTSPHNILGDYPNDFIGGWTSAQGRSLRVIREPGRGSVGSSGPQSPTTNEEPTSPTAPRETILDRAFQMRCIPGLDTMLPGEEKLTSLARFEALQEAEQRKKSLAAQSQKEEFQNWRKRGDGHQIDYKNEDVVVVDDDEEEEGGEGEDNNNNNNNNDNDSENDDSDSNDDNDEYIHAHHHHHHPIPPVAQRQLEYMTARRDSVNAPRIPSARTPVSFYAPPTRPHTLTTPLRPHTAHARSRPSMSNQPRSYSQIASPHTTPASPNGTDVSFSSPPVPDASFSPTSRSEAAINRLSAASNNRVSLTDMAKRLSGNAYDRSERGERSTHSTHHERSVFERTSPGSKSNKSGTKTPVGKGARTPGQGSPPARWEEGECRWRNTVMSTPEGGFV